MKFPLWSVGVLFAAGLLAAACSGKTAPRPPVATTGGTDPGASQGGSSPAAAADAAGAGTGDAGATELPEGGTCNPNNCPTSCCTTLGVCVTQQTNELCGLSGTTCIACAGGTTCIVGTCE